MKRFVLALLFLVYWNALFTFENVPSTPAMRLVPKLSVEILVLVLVLAATKGMGLRLSRIARASLALLLLLASLIRYVDVTAFGVLGREFDLYGDFPHLHRVFAMFLEVMTPALGILVVSVLVLSAALTLSLNWFGLGALDRALESAPWRRGLAAVSIAGIGAFFLPPGRAFAEPVSSIAARQIGHLREGQSAAPLSDVDFPEQSLDSSLSRLAGANVFLIFVESYGITLFEDAHHFKKIEPRYRESSRVFRGQATTFLEQIQSPRSAAGPASTRRFSRLTRIRHHITPSSRRSGRPWSTS
jgi:hypothetical protein